MLFAQLEGEMANVAIEGEVVEDEHEEEGEEGEEEEEEEGEHVEN